jgi:putative endopeptidase
MTMLRAAFLASVAFAVPTTAFSKPAATSPTLAKPQLGTWGVDLTGRDLTIKPGDDFWRHANGNWDKRTQIAPDRTSVGGFVTLADLSETQVRAIVEDVAKSGGKAGTPAQQISDMYASWMNVNAIEARGANVLTPYLAKI